MQNAFKVGRKCLFSHLFLSLLSWSLTKSDESWSAASMAFIPWSRITDSVRVWSFTSCSWTCGYRLPLGLRRKFMSGCVTATGMNSRNLSTPAALLASFSSCVCMRTADLSSSCFSVSFRSDASRSFSSDLRPNSS